MGAPGPRSLSHTGLMLHIAWFPFNPLLPRQGARKPLNKAPTCQSHRSGARGLGQLGRSVGARSSVPMAAVKHVLPAPPTHCPATCWPLSHRWASSWPPHARKVAGHHAPRVCKDTLKARRPAGGLRPGHWGGQRCQAGPLEPSVDWDPHNLPCPHPHSRPWWSQVCP